MISNLELHTKLSNLFHIGFNFITAENTPKPKWRTNRKYRLTRGEFVKRHSDELTLIGVSFGTTTRYFMLDIDKGSQYHPDNDITALPKLRQLLEQIGIVRTDLIRSSHSGGIHLYGCLPKNVSTIRLATAIHVTLIDAGIQIIKGQLECFPNPKPYGEKGHYTYYNPHRVALQPNSGSLLLDEDGEIMLSAENLTHENMLAGFLTRTAQSAQAQDIELLSRIMDTCYAKYTSNKGIAKYQHHHKDYTEVAREWKENLELTIQNIGWTDYGQTNTLLPNFIAYGVVFLGLKGEELENCLYELILTAPGYHDYCRHQHEIKAVIKDWVENTERQGYYVEYCGFPARSGLNPHLTAKRIKASRNHHNDNLAKRTEQRLNAILAALTEIPKQAKAKIAVIRTKSIELFGEAISRNTLYKPEYKPLWFKTEIAKLDSNLEKDPTPPSNSPLTITDQELQPIAIENNIPIPAAQTQSESTSSHTPPLYETYVGRVQSSWLHHQLQLYCINLWCQSILDLQSLSVEPELASDLPDYSNLPNFDSNLRSTSVTLEIQNSPIQNIYNTEDFNNNDLQSEEVAKISNGDESNNGLESPVDIEPDLDPVRAIEIGTKLRRNVQQLGRKTYPALANCQVVSANGLDWVVRDGEGYSWNVSHHALASGVWEIEGDLTDVVISTPQQRSAIDIARQMRLNLSSVPDELLLEFLHHPAMETIQFTIELADRLVTASTCKLVEELVADLSPYQKLDLWKTLSDRERIDVEKLMSQYSPNSEQIDHQSNSIGSIDVFVGATVLTLTGLIGVVKHVFTSVVKPFVVYHESLGRTILYGREDLRLDLS
jgi:hypothetical protein